MAKKDLLNFLKDINFMYNDCGMYDCVSKMLEDFEAEIRAKAIDEFAERISTFGTYDYNGNKIDVFEIAEQLKEE